LAAAGLQATVSAGQIQIASSNGTAFRINSVGATNKLGFNSTVATGVAATAQVQSALTTPATFDAGGSQETGVFAYTPIRNGADAQTITLSAADNSGATQSLAVVLRNDATARNAGSLDQAIDTINSALLQSNNATLQKLVAVKEQSSGAEGIRFISTLDSFSVSVGTNASGSTGFGSQGAVATSTLVGTGSTSTITSQSSAQLAVSALATAVATLGTAQATSARGRISSTTRSTSHSPN